jgi:hypothetical protein
MIYSALQLLIRRVFQLDSSKRNSLDVMPLQIKTQAEVTIVAVVAVRETLQSARKTFLLKKTDRTLPQSSAILFTNAPTLSPMHVHKIKVSFLRGRVKMMIQISRAQFSQIIPDSKVMKLR